MKKEPEASPWPATDALCRKIESYKAFHSSTMMEPADAPQPDTDAHADPSAAAGKGRLSSQTARPMSQLSPSAAQAGVDRKLHATSDAAAELAVVPRAELLGSLKAKPRPAPPLTIWKLFLPLLKAEGAEAALTSDSVCERWAAVSEETKLQWRHAVEEVSSCAARCCRRYIALASPRLLARGASFALGIITTTLQAAPCIPCRATVLALWLQLT